MASNPKHVVRIDDESKRIVGELAKKRGITDSAATDALVKYGASRLAALERYANGKRATSQAAE
jgi:hypothetical protein